MVISHSTTELPFQLFDDDAASHPFQVKTNVLLLDQDNSSSNRLAQAYIRPRRDLVGQIDPPFKRNLPDSQVLGRPQLDAGREWSSQAGYWTVYFQGAVQPNVTKDMDPNSEGGVFGWAICMRSDANWCPQGDGLDDYGVQIFAEIIGVEIPYCQIPDQASHTVLHELGHTFSLEHGTGGVMNVVAFPDCLAFDWFTGSHLSLIRWKGAQQP